MCERHLWDKPSPLLNSIAWQTDQAVQNTFNDLDCRQSHLDRMANRKVIVRGIPFVTELGF